ncbi:hypothetical protein RCL1_007663 [Eukaryota sp. TZLM3-RCL]
MFASTHPIPRIGISTSNFGQNIRACKIALRNYPQIAISGIGGSIPKALAVAEVLRQQKLVEYSHITTGRVTIKPKGNGDSDRTPFERDELLIVLKKSIGTNYPTIDTLKRAGESHLRTYWDNTLLESRKQ